MTQFFRIFHRHQIYSRLGNTLVAVLAFVAFGCILPYSLYQVNLNTKLNKAFLSRSVNFEALDTENCSKEKSPGLSVTRARFDSRRLIRIYDFYYTGEKWDELVTRYSICFATQSSIERIYWIPSILEHWTGPLSLAVYITCEEEWIIFNLFMNYLSICQIANLDQIALHIAVPSNINTDFRINDVQKWSTWNDVEFIQMFNENGMCPEPKQYLQVLMDAFSTHDRDKLKLKEVYPQNHMRNIARKTCGTHWTLSSDIDVIPRNGMADMLQQFYAKMQTNNSCDKCAYVIPTFEIDDSYPYPKNKMETIQYFNLGVAQQFHGKYFPLGHNATDYKRWVNTNIEDGPVIVSHEILANETYRYEPFYISPDHIPAFDERFLGYGSTRNSQFKEASMAGWNFTVLTPVFSVHWGVATSQTVLSPKKNGVGEPVRQNQTEKNLSLYFKIVEELDLKQKLGIF